MSSFRALAAAALLNCALLMPQAIEVSGLNHTKWKLVELNGPIASTLPFTISLEKDSYVFSGCNLMSGKFRIEGNKLVFSQPGPSTLRACAPESEATDTAFSRLAGMSPTFRLDHERLTLSEGDSRWVFQREPLPSQNAKTRFVYVAASTKDCTSMPSLKCLQVRDSKDKPWTLLPSAIIGFDYIPGIEYRLRIKEDQVEHPAAGSPKAIWYLDMVVEQSVVDRKTADDYMKSKRP
jgi:heat shock protein HslJ